MEPLSRQILRTWDDLKASRTTRDQEFQDICDYFLPRKDFTTTPVPGQLRQRRVVTNVGQQALLRAATLFLAHAIGHAQPFLTPNVSEGLARAGRITYVRTAEGRRVDLDDDARDYLDERRWQLFDAQMSPRSGFLVSMARAVLEFLALGNCVTAIVRRPGQGPRWVHRPLRACWWSEDEDGVIDTLYYRFSLPVWRLVKRWPRALGVDAIRRLADDDRRARTPITLLHVVEPREGGQLGAVKEGKPFRSVVILPDHGGAVVEESGYDTFIYGVGRLQMEDGSDYGTGLGWVALPDVKAINHFSGGLERNIDLINDPPTFAPQRLFGATVDRRPGAINYYDPIELGFQNLKDAIEQPRLHGDPQWAERRIAALTQNVEQALFVDWMRLRDSGNMTAEEVRERRDLRLRAMSFLVPMFDRDLLGRGADRAMEVLDLEQLIPAPPRSLSGVAVDWDYAGPLAMAQMATQVDGVMRLFAAVREAATFDQDALDTVNTDEALRAVADALGLPPGVTRSRMTVGELRASRQAAAEEAQANEGLKTAAGALRDGGQGLMALTQAQGLAEAPGPALDRMAA